MIKKIYWILMVILSILPLQLHLAQAQEKEAVVELCLEGEGIVYINDVPYETSTRETYAIGETILLHATNNIEISSIDLSQPCLLEIKENVQIEIKFKEPENALEKQGIYLDLDQIGQISSEEQKIIEQYQKGEKEKFRSLRKQIAQARGLLKYVDEEYFLNENYYENFSFISLNSKEVVLLDRYQFEKKEMARVETIEPRAWSIIDSASFTAVHSPGTITNGLWRLSNQQLAFCAQGMMAEPKIKDVVSEPYIVHSAPLRKALYYGYLGPENIGPSKGWSLEKQIVATNDFCSMAYSNTSLGAQAVSGWHWNQWIGQVYAQIQSKPDPLQYGYQAYMVDVPGNGINWAGSSTAKQKLTFGAYEPKGELQIKKTSSNPSISQDNPNYSFHQGQYGLFQDNKATNQIGTFTFNENGLSNTISDLKWNTYYIKEIKAPKGYALDSRIYPVQIASETLVTFSVNDLPQNNPIHLLLKKVDSETGLNQPQGAASLQNAEYTIKYYTDAECRNLKRTWIMKTDTQGEIYFKESYKVSGDAFYFNSLNQPTLPIGTITIQETKAPEGYWLDPQLYSFTIAASGLSETLLSYQIPTFKEQLIQLPIQKVQKDTDIPIPETKFRHTNPKGIVQEWTTDQEGMIVLKGLELGKHSLEEIKSAPGYVLNSQKIEFHVREDGIHGSDLSQIHDRLIIENEVEEFALKIIKQNESGEGLEGARFALLKEGAVVQEETSNAQGELVFSSLKENELYEVKEIEAPKGYRLPSQPFCTLKFQSSPAQNQINLMINEEWLQELPSWISIEERTIALNIVNHKQFMLPKTGSYQTISWILIGGGWLVMYKKKGKNHVQYK